MDLRGLLKKTFKQDMFSKLKEKDIEKQRVRLEKQIEIISDELKEIQEKIRNLRLSRRNLRKKNKPDRIKINDGRYENDRRAGKSWR